MLKVRELFEKVNKINQLINSDNYFLIRHR